MKLLCIALREKKRGPLELTIRATLDENTGIVGDFRSGNTSKDRQVTILSSDAWAAVCAELGADLPWTTRRANLLMEGLHPSAKMVGLHLHIGSEVILKVTGETKPCKRMDEAHLGLKEALKPGWRAGITCEILRGGQIAVGDKVEIETPAERIVPGHVLAWTAWWTIALVAIDYLMTWQVLSALGALLIGIGAFSGSQATHLNQMGHMDPPGTWIEKLQEQYRWPFVIGGIALVIAGGYLMLHFR